MNLSHAMIQEIEEDHEKKLIWTILFIYTPPVVLLIGTFGNIISIIIFLNLGGLNRQKLFHTRNRTSKTSRIRTVYLYLCLLALFDLGVLCFGLLTQWIYNFSDFNVKITSPWICKIFTFLSFYFRSLFFFYFLLSMYLGLLILNSSILSV